MKLTTLFHLTLVTIATCSMANTYASQAAAPSLTDSAAQAQEMMRIVQNSPSDEAARKSLESGNFSLDDYMHWYGTHFPSQTKTHYKQAYEAEDIFAKKIIEKFTVQKRVQLDDIVSFLQQRNWSDITVTEEWNKKELTYTLDQKFFSTIFDILRLMSRSHQLGWVAGTKTGLYTDNFPQDDFAYQHLSQRHKSEVAAEQAAIRKEEYARAEASRAAAEARKKEEALRKSNETATQDQPVEAVQPKMAHVNAPAPAAAAQAHISAPAEQPSSTSSSASAPASAVQAQAVAALDQAEEKREKETKATAQQTWTVQLITDKNNNTIDSVFTIAKKENAYFMQYILGGGSDLSQALRVSPTVRDAARLVSESEKATNSDTLKNFLQAEHLISLEGYVVWYNALMHETSDTERALSINELTIIDIFVEKLQEKFFAKESLPTEEPPFDRCMHYLAGACPNLATYGRKEYPNTYIHKSFDQTETSRVKRLELLAYKLSPLKASASDVLKNGERAEKIFEACKKETVDKRQEQWKREDEEQLNRRRESFPIKRILHNPYVRWIGGAIIAAGAIYGIYRFGSYMNTRRLARLAKIAGIKA